MLGLATGYWMPLARLAGRWAAASSVGLAWFLPSALHITIQLVSLLDSPLLLLQPAVISNFNIDTTCYLCITLLVTALVRLASTLCSTSLLQCKLISVSIH